MLHSKRIIVIMIKRYFMINIRSIIKVILTL